MLISVASTSQEEDDDDGGGIGRDDTEPPCFSSTEDLQDAMIHMAERHPSLSPLVEGRIEGRGIPGMVLFGEKGDEEEEDEDEDVYVVDTPLADSYAEVLAAGQSRLKERDGVKPPPMPVRKPFSLAKYGKL